MFKKILVANRGEIAIGARSRPMPRQTSSGDAASTQARRSKPANVISSSTPSASRLVLSSMPPIFSTAMVLVPCSLPSGSPARGCVISSPMAAIRGRTCPARSGGSADGCFICSPRKASISTFGFSSSETAKRGLIEAVIPRHIIKAPARGPIVADWLDRVAVSSGAAPKARDHAIGSAYGIAGFPSLTDLLLAILLRINENIKEWGSWIRRSR